ncbi:LamG domain protein jellyroll fold domain protein [Sporocytophaga myxococcoides]|uniref:LamG domain protein jellyroll fold domain protein n=1 Tax=Sporocytophaga myxococcoides TaxID=153721 RepID=A0A098LJU6_9BACT|nr:LamG-like jellyroll fold domain-containing protein [Sporocytophaga myxococcoides]GAL86408.1 LamG domain protein jellyroll fold domain protein [Sporocytophaga myxococcoides]
MKKILLFVLVLFNFSLVKSENKLVAYYSFSGDLTDASGNSNNGTSHGATLTTDRCGNENGAYHFDGSSYISLPTKDFINSNYTYAMWVSFEKLKSVTSFISIGAKGGDQSIQVNPSGAGWSGGGYNSDGTLTGAIPGKYPSVNRWYHVILTRDNSSMKLYIDGQLEATASTSNKAPSYAKAPYYAVLGARGLEEIQFLTGKLDEVRIYNYALSMDEIDELYNSYTCNKLVAFYPFTGDIIDVSGNGNNGTSHGATLTTDRCGNENSAYHFDGSSYISLPTKDFINSNYTYAMWVSFDHLNSVETVISIGANGGDQSIQVNSSVAGWAGGGYNSDGTVTGAIPGKYPSVDSWYHVILTRDNSSMKLYVNGQLEATASTSNKAPSYAKAPYYAVLGARGLEEIQFLKGKLDEVRVYNYALSTDEIGELYNSYSCGTSAIDDQSVGEHLLEVFPNPADGKFFVKYDRNRLAVSKITINSAIGETISTIEDAETTQNFEIQLNGQPSGIYFVSFKTLDGAIFTKRVLLK